ncbi:MAG: exodeoxyribonuclease III [Planctomycetota bacterium]|nr:MAG: exodeoxyribonuclease III [Planctomycetota bacterium]
MRVVSMNLNGLRSAADKGFLAWLAEQEPDLVCVQEIRIQEHQLTPALRRPAGLHASWAFADRPGYSGVGIWSRRPPDRVRTGFGWEPGDREGRFLQADFGRLSVVSLYLPSGSAREDRQEFKYRFMRRFESWLVRARRSRRHVLVCGDWNIAHRPIDLKNWRANQDRSGFLPEERAWLDRVFGPLGWIDVHRRLAPEATGEAYTWWSNRGRARANNTGWRIDYQVATPGLGRRARAVRVHRLPRFSDHGPLVIDYEGPVLAKAPAAG